VNSTGYSTAMKLTCMLLKHILSILVFGDNIMCPHPSNNAKNIFKMHTAGNFCAKYFPQKNCTNMKKVC
jgi:hypothetical protein